MGKKLLKSRKRKEQTIAIIIVAAVVLLITAGILIWIASKNDNLGGHDHDHDHEHGTISELTLKVALSAQQGDAHYKAVESFKEQVETRSEGAIKVEIYGNGALGNDKEMLQALEKDSKVVDIVITDVANFTDMDARMDISALPFLFSGYDDAYSFMDGDIQKQIERALWDKNIYVLAHYSDGFECMTTTKKAVNKAADAQGLVFATTEKNYSVYGMKAIGANTIVMEKGDVFQSLNQGRCDGYLGTATSIYKNHLHQTMDYVEMTYHSYKGLAFAISKSVWQSMGEEAQSIIQTAALNSAYTDRMLVQQEEQTAIKNMETAGVKILYPKLTTFFEKSENMLRGYSTKYGTLIEKAVMERKVKENQ